MNTEPLLLLETCEKCGNRLTLMESLNADTRKPYLVKRCLMCFEHGPEEVAELAQPMENAIIICEDDTACCHERCSALKRIGEECSRSECTKFDEELYGGKNPTRCVQCMEATGL
ncbi:MAG: hypothetical protein ACQ5SW_08425 [Sphaerochaetaceae bacterium]